MKADLFHAENNYLIIKIHLFKLINYKLVTSEFLI